VLYPKFFGTARDRTDYFALGYTRLIEYAITHGYRRIDYGGGAHQAKLLRGARLRPAMGVLLVVDDRLRHPLLPLARQVSDQKRAHFEALAGRWQVPHLPLDPAFTHDRTPLEIPAGGR
jgi:hypothetical protein